MDGQGGLVRSGETFGVAAHRVVGSEDLGDQDGTGPGTRSLGSYQVAAQWERVASLGGERTEIHRGHPVRRSRSTHGHYSHDMGNERVPGGVVHALPTDLRAALTANVVALDAWRDITPLARNEFICWVEDAKQASTRERRIRRTQEELEEGQRRPCCWPGCRHRERTGRAVVD